MKTTADKWTSTEWRLDGLAIVLRALLLCAFVVSGTEMEISHAAVMESPSTASGSTDLPQAESLSRSPETHYATRKSNRSLPEVRGTWKGTIRQVVDGGRVVFYDVTMVIDDLNPNQLAGTVDYPCLECGGTLQFEEETQDAFSFIEDLTGNTIGCVETGRIILAFLGEDTVDWTWESLDEFKYHASGRLFRVGGSSGACQFPDGTCSLLDPSFCSGMGGEHQGAESLCLSYPCDPKIESVIPDSVFVGAPTAPLVASFNEPVTGTPNWTVTVNGALVSGQASLDRHHAMFLPDAPFQHCDQVSVKLDGGLRDDLGGPTVEQAWEFTVACDVEIVDFPQAPPNRRFSLMSVPVEIEGRPSELFAHLGPQGESTWRAFRWNGQPYEEDGVVGPGDAFWIAGTEEVFSGQSLSLSGTPLGAGFRVPLEVGWNLVGIPVPGSVAGWGEVLVTASSGVTETVAAGTIVGPPLYYVDHSSDWINNGGYVPAPAPSSNPHGGYWFHATESCELIFGDAIVSALAASPSAHRLEAPPALRDDEWTLEISARAGSQGDSGVRIGTRLNASRMRDRSDVQKPPSFQSELALSTSVSGEVEPFLISHQSPLAATHEWGLRVEGLAHFVDLHWSERDLIPAGVHLYLFDENDRFLANMSARKNVRVVLAGERNLIVRAGREELDFPAPTASLRIGPNPLQSTGQIRLEMDRAEKVLLSVCDVSGRQVAEIYGGLLDAGVHQFEWTPSGSGSGVYFLRGQVGQKVVGRKILVVR